jgi:hypothetical protein
MPAVSFQEKWINKLLRGDKQQTTRPQTTRIWIGDPIVHIYNQQRRSIIDKPLLMCTKEGKWIVRGLMKKRHHYPQLFYDSEGGKIYPHLLDWGAKSVRYHAHFLGKVKITEVYDIHPSEMSGEELEAWAWADGFSNFDPITITPESVAQSANWWFSHRYGNDWMQQTWTVIRWHGWVERYFEPEGV